MCSGSPGRVSAFRGRTSPAWFTGPGPAALGAAQVEAGEAQPAEKAPGRVERFGQPRGRGKLQLAVVVDCLAASRPRQALCALSP